MTTDETLADALVRTLDDWGIRFVFGVSGANVEHLHDAIHRSDNVSSIMARSEVGAAFMADARGRVKDELGVCCATSGGGMMNLAVGLAESFADSVPVLAIVGQPATPQHGRGAFQDGSGIGRTVDARAMFASMTKYVAAVDDAALFWEQLDAAARAAVSGRPGPAVLLVPRDLWDRPVPARPADFPVRLSDAHDAVSTPDEDSLAQVLTAIRTASNPVVIAGPGARPAREVLGLLAERAGLPVMTTMADIGAFSHEHSHFRGVVGAAGHPSSHAYVNGEADLVIGVGTTFDLMTRAGIVPGLERASVVVIDVDADQADRSLDVSATLVGDIEANLGALVERLGKSLHRTPPPLQPTRYAPQRVVPGAVIHGDELTTSQAISVLQRYLPDEGHLVFDAGNCAATALHHLDIPSATTTTLALGQGGMGYALAGGVALALDTEPNERTVVLAGDGAFLMLGNEIHTAVDLGVPILYVVFNDNQHGMCVTRQGLFFDGREECVRYGELDVASVCRGYGSSDRLWVRQASTPQQVLTALAEFHADGGRRPGVLELKISVDEMPPFAPFLPADAAVIPASGVRLTSAA